VKAEDVVADQVVPEPIVPVELTPINFTLDDAHRKATRLLLSLMSDVGIEEATFHYDSGKMGIRQMTPDHVAMIIATIDVNNGLDEINVSRNFTVGIDAFERALKLSKLQGLRL